jgi:hypothetical protein
MNRLSRVLESSVYLPLHPKNFKLLVRILRWFEWLPSINFRTLATRMCCDYFHSISMKFETVMI